MADTSQALEVPPEHLYQLLEIVRMRDLSDAAFRTLVCLYSLAWVEHGNFTPPLSSLEMARARRISEDRLKDHLAELAGLKLIRVATDISELDLSETSGLEEAVLRSEKFSIDLLPISWDGYEWPLKEDQYIEIAVSPQGIVSAEARDATKISGSAQDILDFLESGDIDELP